jgi:transcriptional regulator with GAF, ATPase, and Fis domain
MPVQTQPAKNHRAQSTNQLKAIKPLSIIERAAQLMIESGLKLVMAQNELRKAVVVRAMTMTEGNQLRAALLLGVHRSTLGRDLNRFKIRKDRKHWHEMYIRDKHVMQLTYRPVGVRHAVSRMSA